MITAYLPEAVLDIYRAAKTTGPTPKSMNTSVPSITYIRGYSFKELCALYDESPRVLRKWLKPHKEAIGPCLGRKYTPKQVEIIFSKLSLPKKITDVLDQHDTNIKSK